METANTNAVAQTAAVTTVAAPKIKGRPPLFLSMLQKYVGKHGKRLSQDEIDKGIKVLTELKQNVTVPPVAPVAQ